MGWMFNQCHKLKQIKGINNFNTNKVTDMNIMFQECNELEYLDLSNFNTSNVKDMGWMFNECHKLKEIKGIENFNTIKVKNMTTMFQNCNELEYLDLSNFNTSNVEDMGYLFTNCYKLKEIKGIENFNTIKVKNMTAMFQDCYELENLDLSNFNTSNVEDMEAMFNGCTKLKEIKGINNFDLKNVKQKENIFDGCNNLNQIILSKFNVKISNNNEKHIHVFFNETDSGKYYFIPCYISDIFKKVEEKLYDKIPQLKNKQIYFTFNGVTINESDTLEKHNIKSSANILINYYKSKN